MAVRSHEGSFKKSAPILNRIVVSVADHTGMDPLEMDPPLHEVIDCDALENMFPATDSSTVESLEFSYHDCRVLVAADGSVEILD